MAEENSGVPSEANEAQVEENKDVIRKDAPKESKLASLAKLSRPFNAKREKDKVDPIAKFQEGVFFKAKIIGVEDVPDARGDRMCQVSLQRLKAVVKNSGEHKTKVTVCVSIEGLKIREEKTADLLYHHPVHRISFIAQDTTDNRAFGYIFGAPDVGHKFYALKTEKAASFLVIAMRDLFQVVYDMKKQEIERAKEHRRTLGEQELLAQLPQGESSPESPEAQIPVIQVEDSAEVVDDLLDLESELDNLRKGISQIDTTISSAAEVKKSQDELDKLVADPFGDSFVVPPPSISQTDSQMTRPVTVSGTSPVPATLMPPPPSKKGPQKNSEELASLFDAPIAPNPNLKSSFNPFSSPSYPPNQTPANAPFGNPPMHNSPFVTPPTNSQFANPASTNSPFVNAAPTNSPFSNPPTNSPFGNPAPSEPVSGTFDTPHFEAFTTDGPFESSILSPERAASFEEPVEEPVEEPPVEEKGPLDVLAALDPLGNNRPFVNKQQFFKDLKPQKIALKDLTRTSNVSMTLSRNPFDVDVENSVPSEDVICVPSPPLPPRLPSNVNLSASPGISAPKSKNPDNWVNFDTSPPEVPPPPLPSAPPPSDSVPPTPPPRPPTSVVLTPPLPKKEKTISYSPNPFISSVQEPRTSSDAGYDSYDDIFETTGTSPSSVSSPPTSPPIPIPSRRPPMSNLRHSPLIYDHKHSTSAITKSSIGHVVQPTSHSFPASQISNVDSMIVSNVHRKTPDCTAGDSNSPCTSSSHSSPEFVRKSILNGTATASETCDQLTLSSLPNVNASSISVTPPSAEKEKLNNAIDRYAAIESLDKGEFSSIFDQCSQSSQSGDKADEEDCDSDGNEATVPEFDESLVFQQNLPISDPFDTDSITNHIYKNSLDAEALFKASFPENPVESDNFESGSPSLNNAFRASFPEDLVESHEMVKDVKTLFKASFPDEPIESQTTDSNLHNVFGTSFADEPVESQISATNLHSNIPVFKANFPDKTVENENLEKDLNAFSPVFKASFPGESCESQIGQTDVKLNGDKNKSDELPKILELDSSEKKSVSGVQTVLSPVSYLNSKDIFHRENDPFDDDFFQESEVKKEEAPTWTSVSFEEFKFDV